eukprot:1059415-Prymnesium_polylepis.2
MEWLAQVELALSNILNVNRERINFGCHVIDIVNRYVSSQRSGPSAELVRSTALPFIRAHNVCPCMGSKRQNTNEKRQTRLELRTWNGTGC